MGYLTEPEPRRGTPSLVADGVHRLVAPNPGPMTYHGTNTYIYEDSDGLVVIDPGPMSEDHVAAVVRATQGRVARILVTHSHRDHLGAATALQQATQAPIAAFHESAEPDFTPDIGLEHGSMIGRLQAVHTPGHAADHLCYAREDGLLFTGDHVMAWCSTVVPPPPRGNMKAFFNSLKLLIQRPDRLYLPGHGPALADPQPYVQEFLDRRLAREQAIWIAVRDGLSDPAHIADALYRKRDPVIRRAAERNVLSHLAKLEAEGRVRGRCGHWKVIG